MASILHLFLCEARRVFAIAERPRYRRFNMRLISEMGDNFKFTKTEDLSIVVRTIDDGGEVQRTERETHDGNVVFPLVAAATE